MGKGPAIVHGFFRWACGAPAEYLRLSRSTDGAFSGPSSFSRARTWLGFRPRPQLFGTPRTRLALWRPSCGGCPSAVPCSAPSGPSAKRTLLRTGERIIGGAVRKWTGIVRDVGLLFNRQFCRCTVPSSRRWYKTAYLRLMRTREPGSSCLHCLSAAPWPAGSGPRSEHSACP